LIDQIIIINAKKREKKLNYIAEPLERGLFQKLAYAVKCDADTVFFSKRQKNSSLCHHHTAPCLIQLEITSFYMQAA